MTKRTGTFCFGLIDRYLLRMLTGPLLGCLGVTIAALILERVLRLLDLLSNSNARFGALNDPSRPSLSSRGTVTVQ